MRELDELELLLILGVIGFVVYWLYKHGLLGGNPNNTGFGWPLPGNESTNVGGQTVGTSKIGTQYNINSAGWTIFPPDGSAPIVNLNPVSTPVGPGGESIAQLQASGWSNEEIADMVGMSWGNPVTSAPVGGAGGSWACC